MTRGKTTGAPGLFPAAAILALEGLAALGLGVVELASTRADRPVIGITTGLVFLVYGVVLVLAGNGVRRARRWARGVAVFTQVLHLPIAYSFWSGGLWWVTVALALCAVLTLVGVLVPSSTRAFVVGRASDAEVSERPQNPAGATPRKR